MKIIPIFIPHAGCPYKCVYCDQHKISGALKLPTAEIIQDIVRRNLKTISPDEEKEIAFFGGTFTFLSEELQRYYLDAVYPYVKNRIVKGIRISTHPESVSLRTMGLFKKRGGRLVELGIQSLDKDVLRKIKREVSFEDVKKAAARIKKSGLKLGIQVMLGLPGDTLKKSIATAVKLVRLRPETARIYPALVLEDTELAEQYRKGKYKPLNMDEAIEQAAKIADILERSGVKVIRIGLHPSKGLNSKKILLAGPFHAAFGEMVRARQITNRIIRTISDRHVANRSYIKIHAPEDMFNIISGHRGLEKRFLERYFRVPIVFKSGRELKAEDIRQDIVLTDPRMPRQAQKRLERLNYRVIKTPLHKKLRNPVSGHPDMMLFRHEKEIIYEPALEGIANLLRQNGYNCIKGEGIRSGNYPYGIIYNACLINGCVIHYKDRIETHIKHLKLQHIPVRQGYAKCSVVPISKEYIITSDTGIRDAWVNKGGKALLVSPGYVKLPGYKTGFIGGASGVTDKTVLFVGKLDSHRDGYAIRNFIKETGKGIIELYDGPLYDVGTIIILPGQKMARFSLGSA